MRKEKEKKQKKLKTLFVQDLVRVLGGHSASPAAKPKCPPITTLACGEERHGCSGC